MKRKTKVLNEIVIKKQIKSYLKQVGCRAFSHLQGLGSYPGLPDIQGSYQRKHFFIEVKTKDGRLSVPQAQFLLWATEEGYETVVAHSLEEFLEWWNSEITGEVKLVCQECGEKRPGDPRVRAGMRCSVCAYGRS